MLPLLAGYIHSPSCWLIHLLRVHVVRFSLSPLSNNSAGEITELESKLGEEEGRREAAEAQVSELEEKLRNTIEMATERMRAMQTGSGAGGGRAKKR